MAAEDRSGTLARRLFDVLRAGLEAPLVQRPHVSISDEIGRAHV